MESLDTSTNVQMSQCRPLHKSESIKKLISWIIFYMESQIKDSFSLVHSDSRGPGICLNGSSNLKEKKNMKIITEENSLIVTQHNLFLIKLLLVMISSNLFIPQILASWQVAGLTVVVVLNAAGFIITKYELVYV